MDTSSPGGADPVSFAVAHQRPKGSFQGCSRIGDYTLLGKLGEGTFGYVVLATLLFLSPSCRSALSLRTDEARSNANPTVKFTERVRKRPMDSSR